MAEKIVFTKPVKADPGATTFRPTLVHLDWEADQVIVRLREVSASGLVSDGKVISHNYSGSAATTLLKTLNTANLSTKSLHRRIMEKLQADGVIGSGSISGAPDVVGAIG